MTPVPSTLILASAGTGKTYALSSRYIDLLERGVSPSRILATTFTRQAAGEILDRVLLRLLEGRNVGAMRAMLQGIDRVRVSTLDSLFSQIAAGSATDVGLPRVSEMFGGSMMMHLSNAADDSSMSYEGRW